MSHETQKVRLLVQLAALSARLKRQVRRLEAARADAGSTAAAFQLQPPRSEILTAVLACAER